MASGAAAAAAGDGIFRCIYEGCIAGCDTGVERRPYHRNCGCALHKSRKNDKNKNHCSHGLPKSKNISYPIRRSWSEGCLAMAAAAAQSSTSSSPSSSPAAAAMVGVGSRKNHYHHNRLSSFDEADEKNTDVFFFKV